MADEIGTGQMCLNCINIQNKAPETLQFENEVSTGNIERKTTREQIIGDHCCDCKNSGTKKNDVTPSYYGTKVFIGNLRHDVERDLVVRRLQELLSTVGMCISDDDFSRLIKGPRKTKFLFVKLKSTDQVECVINHFDGFQDEEIVAEKRALKICLKKEDRPTRRRRKGKRKDSRAVCENENSVEGIRRNWDIGDTTDEEMTVDSALENRKRLEDEVTTDRARDDNFISGSFEGYGWKLKGSRFEMKTNDASKDDLKKNFERGSSWTEKKLLTSRPKLVSGDKKTQFEMQISKHQELAYSISMPNLSVSENTNRESGTGKAYVMGQILPNEDRRIEYKMINGKCFGRRLIGHVRRYSCAFLNSEGR